MVLNIPIDNIFNTSIEATSITSGEDFRQAIKESLKRASHIIQVITLNYKNSEVCMNEMGAAWVLGSKVKPFVLDPIGYSNVGFLNAPNQLLKLDDARDVLAFVDEMKRDLVVKTPTTEISRHVQDFINKVNEHKNIINSWSTTSTNQDLTEIIFFDSNNTKEYYIRGKGEQIWKDGKGVGEPGKGTVKFQESVMNIERFNTAGRFVVTILKYQSASGIKECIESNIYNYAVRTISVEFEAKTIGGKYTLLVVAKRANSSEWIHGANFQVDIINREWKRFKEFLFVPADNDFIIFIDNREIEKSDCSLQLKNFIIKEVF